MKIAIVVHGRFHAFDLARELIGLGHEVLLLTNYPKNWPERFGVPAKHVRSCLAHGILSRAAQWMGKRVGREKLGEPFLHQWFARWAANQLSGQGIDLTHLFSGVALETLLQKERTGKVHSLMRGSSHIELQKKILEEEEQRAGQRIDGPSRWMMQRENMEYEKADFIQCLSQFAYKSFLDQGVGKEKVVVNPLGVSLSSFKTDLQSVRERNKRILSGGRLRVLTVGNFSLQKGILDQIAVAKKMHQKIEFYHRGALSSDSSPHLKEARKYITLLPPVQQHQLSADYVEADIFLLPTLQDGFAAVLVQAAACGLPILTTTNCGANDFLSEERGAWIVPIRRPDLIVERLKWCDENREALAKSAIASSKPNPGLDWKNHALKLIQYADPFLAKKLKR